ncbi:MAG: ROK family protein [Acutalibacteraceae bacterium]|nr:ROK family protein [Acutalibacteraceae bacterium]
MKGNTKLRQKSIKRVLTEIRNRGPVSKRELQDITGFSWGNISSITAELFNENYIMVSGKQDTFVGRKPEIFDINNNDNFIIGIDFSTKGILAVLCDLRGRAIVKMTRAFAEMTYECAINTLYAVIECFINDYKDKKILHIAIAMQGDVDHEKGVSMRIKAIEGWRNVPVCDLVSQKFGIKVAMLHDPECLLYTEKNYGILEGVPIENALILSITNHGIGIATMLGGKTYMGNKGRTSEIGTVVVPYGEKMEWHCLDTVLKENWVQKEYNSPDVTAKVIAEMARSGNNEALSIFKNIGTSLGYALNNASILLNPEKIILFGSFCKYSDLFLQSAVLQLQTLMGEYAPIISVSSFEEDSAAIGATLYATDIAINDLNFN